jgi:hypothetical protein
MIKSTQGLCLLVLHIPRLIVSLKLKKKKNFIDMPDPDALWRDVQKLDDLYEELLWHPDDELQFTHDGKRVIIINKTLEEKQ